MLSNFGGSDTGATAIVNNAGTFTKSGTAATSTIATTFNNRGIVNVQSGTLNLSGGGSDFGASYTGAGTIEFGGSRTFAGNNTIANPTLNNAALSVVNGTLAVLGSITGTGSLAIGNNSTLELGGADAQTVSFLAGNGTLRT